MLAAVERGGNKAVFRSRADLKRGNIPPAAAAPDSRAFYKLIFGAKVVYRPSPLGIIVNNRFYKPLHHTTLP